MLTPCSEGTNYTNLELHLKIPPTKELIKSSYNVCLHKVLLARLARGQCLHGLMMHA